MCATNDLKISFQRPLILQKTWMHRSENIIWSPDHSSVETLRGWQYFQCMSSLSPKTSQGVREHELRPAQGMPLDAVPDMGLDVRVRQQELRQAQDVQPLLVPEIPPLVSSGGPRSSHGGSRSEEHRPPVQGPRSVSRLISRAARREQPFDLSCNTKLICGNLVALRTCTPRAV